MTRLLVLVLLTVGVLAPQPARAQVITEASTRMAPVVTEDSGSALVSADREWCARSSELVLATVRRVGRGLLQAEVASAGVRQCRWIAEKLEPGSYEVALIGPKGSGGAVRFDAIAGTAVDVRIGAPSVAVVGRVLINGEPATTATLGFSPGLTSLTRVVIDEKGHFEATLPEAGRYSVRLSGDDLYGQSIQRTFTAGDNALDWQISGGTLTIRLNEPVAFGAQIQVVSENGSMQSKSPSRGKLLVFKGVPVGAYVVSARRDRRQASDTLPVTVNGVNDAPTVTLMVDAPSAIRY